MADFPATRWSLILAARGDAERRRLALEELLGLYWKPLYFFARRKGLGAEDAEDAVQDFLARALEKDILARADAGRGRFRSFLRTAIANHLLNLHEEGAALKHGGGAVRVSLDFDIAERDLGGTPAAADAAYDRAWAWQVMERAMERLRQEFESGARSGPFELVRRYFQPEAGELPAYPVLAAEYGMSVEGLKAFLHRARSRYRQLVREEVAHTVDAEADVDAEMRELLRCLTT